MLIKLVPLFLEFNVEFYIHYCGIHGVLRQDVILLSSRVSISISPHARLRCYNIIEIEEFAKMLLFRKNSQIYNSVFFRANTTLFILISNKAIRQIRQHLWLPNLPKNSITLNAANSSYRIASNEQWVGKLISHPTEE